MYRDRYIRPHGRNGNQIGETFPKNRKESWKCALRSPMSKHERNILESPAPPTCNELEISKSAQRQAKRLPLQQTEADFISI
jgi:hypothetical protein